MSDRTRQLKLTGIAAIVLMCCTAAPSFAATPADFYVDLLQKGIAEYNAENYSQAASLLRVAAFGLLEATDRYQTAEVYRTIAADKLKDAESVRDAAKRVIAAERVTRTYASLTLPNGVRSLFEDVAKKVLASADMALLKSPAPSPQQTAQTTTPPRTTTTTTTTPAKPAPKPEDVKPPETKPAESKPAQIKPDPKPAQIKPDPKPAQTTTTTTKPAPAKPAPVPAATTAQPRDTTQQLATADRAIAAGNLTDARKLYKQLLGETLTHEQAIRVAEGLYRARDFASVIRAFDRAGALKRGEEPYRFYLAVALYETGKFTAAKKELAAALNYIEITPDVARYREKIEGAAD